MWQLKILIIGLISSYFVSASILPTTTSPLHYDLRLNIDVEKETLSGDVAIRFNVTSENVTLIALNYFGIQLEDSGVIHLANDSSSANLLQSVTPLSESETVQFNTREFLVEGVEYVIRLNFTGVILNNLKGLYLSSYFTGEEKRTIATTFFAPNLARRVFPCYDEPHFKATFDVQITHSNKFHALGNSPVRSVVASGVNMSTTTFQRTPKMSTYLVAFIVSDLVASRPTGNNPKNIGVWSQDSRRNSTSYALEFAGQVLTVLEDYLGLPYQMNKLDLVAVDDFLMGAMENWGLITFASARLLGDPLHSTTAERQGILKIVSHELAHQWFGNLVTCRWWDDIWLNEGFATYMEDLMAARVANQWLLMDQFVTTEKIPAMRKDSERAHRKAMSQEVSTLEQISNIYDFVAYPKAGSVIRMFHHVVGDQVFQQTVREYLQTFQYSSAGRADFFAVLEKVARQLNWANPQGISLSEAFEHWADNFGFPLITVTRLGAALRFDQNRFAHSNFNPHTPEVDFFVPLRFATEESPVLDTSIAMRWLTPRAPTMQMSVPGDSWYLINPDATGYFRVNYDSENWMKLKNALHTTNNITASGRVQLIDDVMTLARFGHVPFATALDLVRYIKKEVNYTPISIALDHLEELFRNLRAFSVNSQALWEEILDSLYVTKREATHANKLLEARVTDFACKLGYPRCIQDSHELFKTFLQNQFIDPDHRASMFCGVVQTSGELEGRFRDVFNLWTDLASSEANRVTNERVIQDILQGFSCVRQQTFLQELLVYSLRNNVETFMTSADRLSIFSSVVSGSLEGTELGFNMVMNNWNNAVDGYGDSPKIYAALAPNVVTPRHNQLFNELVFVHMKKSAETRHEAIQSAVRQVEENVQFLSNHRSQLEQWFQENFPSSTIPLLSPRLSVVVLVVVTLYLLI